MEIKAIHDLSVSLETYMPTFPGSPHVDVRPMGTVVSDGSKLEMINTTTHSGTHVDAPSHMIEDGISIDQVSLERVVGRGYVVRPHFSGTEIELDAIRRIWNEDYDGNIILINTNWDKKRGFTREFQYDFPGLCMDAANFMSDHGVKAIGIDTLSIEPFDNSDFRVHKKLLGKGIVFIEDLAGLDKLDENKPYLIAALPLRIKNGSGSMARVIAMEVY